MAEEFFERFRETFPSVKVPMKDLRKLTISEIESYGESLLEKFSLEHKVTKPGFMVTTPPYIFGTMYLPPTKAILLRGSPIWKYWIREKEIAKKLIDFTIAHEFKHYLQHLEGATQPVKWIRERWKEEMEKEANKFAEEKTGVPFSYYKQFMK